LPRTLAYRVTVTQEGRGFGKARHDESRPDGGWNDRPLRAVHVTSVHQADDARILYREAAELKALGLDVAVIGPYERDGVVEGVCIRAIRRPASRLWRILSAPWRALAAARRVPSDVLHFHDPELLPAALVAKAVLCRAVVFDAHEDVSLFALKDWLPRGVRKVVSAAMGVFHRFCARRLDGVVVPTRLLHEKYLGLAPRVVTFVNYPPPAALRMRDEAWQPVAERRNEVVHLGTLRIARLEFLIEVGRRFLDRHPDWSMTLLGMHPAALEHFERNVRGPIRERLRGCGKMSHPEVIAYLCRARVGVNYHPLDSEQVRVAIPAKVFEYLACGLPVVTTEVPLLKELLADCPAVRWSEDSAESFADALAETAARADLAQVADQGRRFSDERFRCEAEARRLLAMYRDIFGRAPDG